MKVGLVGTGYWGQILLSNLKEEGFDIITYDLYDAKADTNKRSDLDSCDKVLTKSGTLKGRKKPLLLIAFGIKTYSK